MWDKMDEIKENMEVMRQEMPDMEKQIGELQAELACEKRKTAAFALYKTADAEQTVSISSHNKTYLVLPGAFIFFIFSYKKLKLTNCHIYLFAGSTRLQVPRSEAERFRQI